jgi:hypothetical protein
MMPLRIVCRDLAAGEVGAEKLEQHGDQDRLADRQRPGAHGGAHGVGDVVGTDTPGHEEARDAGQSEELRAEFGDDFHARLRPILP